MKSSAEKQKQKYSSKSKADSKTATKQKQKTKQIDKQRQKEKQRERQKQKIKHKQKQKQRQRQKSKEKQKQKLKNEQRQPQLKYENFALKKTKSGFAKIKSHIQHTVNAKKIMQLIKKSTRTIPHLLTKQQSKALLPKLQKLILPQINRNQDLQLMNSKKKFNEIEDKLTHSMVLFKKNAQQISKNQLWAIDMQTQKCYKMIPQFYFKVHANTEEEQLTKNLNKYMTKNPRQINQAIFNLMDFLDQVQFNINQQANAKIQMFMNFVLCMNSIQDLVMINTGKLSTTRKHIGILRDIIVSRAIRINQQRLKKENIEQTLRILQIFKKLKVIENKLNVQISLGNFIPHDNKSKLGALFSQYCGIHNEQLNKFCCRNNRNIGNNNSTKRESAGNKICKYWDITYFVQRGFQDNFMKMIKSYIFQIIVYQKQVEKYSKSFTHNKKNFMTSPNNTSGNSIESNITSSGFNILDQSYQVDAYDHVELITKIHIQKQIVALLQQGMYKYSFTTELLQKELKQYISSYLNNFLEQILGVAGQAQSRATLKDIGDNRHNFNSNNGKQKGFLQTEKCKQKILKTNWPQFDKIMQLLTTRFEYLSIRILSLVQRLLDKISEIEQQHPQRYQVMSTYFVQLIDIVLNQTDYYLSLIIRYKNKGKDEKSINIFKSKQQINKQVDFQYENMKKLVRYCKKWLCHVENLQKNYMLSRKQLLHLFSSNSKNQTNSLNGQSNKISMKADSYSYTPKIRQLKLAIVKSNCELFHKILISRSLKQKLEEDSYQFIEIKTQFYNDLGYIIGGNQFLVEEQRTQRQLLPNSILMERSQSETERSQNQQGSNNHRNLFVSNTQEQQPKQTQYKKQEYSSRFKINPNYITLSSTNLKFKIVASTQFMIKSLRKLLELYDDLIVPENYKDSKQQSKYNDNIRTDFHAKLTQIILMYNQYIKDLILKGQILKYGKVKSKSVTAKILIIAYIQLQVIDIMFTGQIIQKRVRFSKQQCLLMREKILATQVQIRKKYQKILQMRIIQTIDSINFKQKENWLQSQLFLSIPKNFHSSLQLFDTLMLNSNQFKGFLDIESTWTAQLLNKINKLPKAKQLKVKCFNILVDEIEQFKQYIPRVYTAIKSATS